MTYIHRFVVLAAGAATALAFAGQALATQKLEVSQSASAGSVTIKLSQAQTDQQPAQIAIYAPNGYTLNTSQAAGTKIGTTTGEVFARDLNIPLPLTGDVLVDNPQNHLMDSCAPGVHAAVWILNLAVAGQTIALPVYVDPTTGTATALGAIRLITCLGPADVPLATPGRSPNGAQLLSATFTVTGVLTPPSGTSRWLAFTTPWGTGTGVPNPTGTVETRSTVGPGSITISGKVTNKRRKDVSLSGRATQSGLGAAGRVSILINGRARGTATANASGRYAKKVKGTGKRSTFQSKITVGARDITATGCSSPTIPAYPCVSATAGGFTATSRKITLRF